MKAQVLCCATLLVLAACASQPPRCDGRLTPINPRALGGHGTAGSPAIAARASKQGRP